MNKPPHTNNHKTRSITESLVAAQVAETVKDKKRRKPRASKNQLSKTPKPSKQATVVEAKIDVGFGNSLFIRGRGAELSWDKGLPLKCIDGSAWIWSTKQAKDKVVFKLLLNDQVWARGEDVVLEPGKSIQIVPVF